MLLSEYRRLHHISDAQVLSRFTASEWMREQRLFLKAPFGVYGEWYRWALQMSLMANANRDPKKRARAFEINDFLPDMYKRTAVQQSNNQAFDPTALAEMSRMMAGNNRE